MSILIQANDLEDVVGKTVYGIDETGVFLSNTHKDKLLKNYATGFDENSITGVLNIESQGTRFQNMTRFVSTKLVETEQMTIATVAKFHSSNAFIASNHIPIGATGVGLWRATNGALQFFADRAGQLATASTGVEEGSWVLGLGTTNGLYNRVVNYSSGTEGISTVGGVRNIRSNPFCVGSAAGGTYAGEATILMTVILNHAITEQEEKVLVKFMRNYANKYGISV